MQISEETIKDFQEMFKKDYGEKLSKQEAFDAAYNLLGFFSLLLEVDMRNNPERYKPKKKKP